MKKDEVKIPVKYRVSSMATPLDYKVLSDKETNLTKKSAYAYLELETFSGERLVREKHVQFLFDEWAAGRFIWHHVLMASATLNGTTYRINGQHTCWMRVNIPEKAEPVSSTVRLVEYQVETIEQLRGLYSTFDRNAPRTVGHVSVCMLQDTHAGRELIKSVISQLVPGFRIFFAED